MRVKQNDWMLIDQAWPDASITRHTVRRNILAIASKELRSGMKPVVATGSKAGKLLIDGLLLTIVGRAIAAASHSFPCVRKPLRPLRPRDLRSALAAAAALAAFLAGRRFDFDVGAFFTQPIFHLLDAVAESGRAFELQGVGRGEHFGFQLGACTPR